MVSESLTQSLPKGFSHTPSLKAHVLPVNLVASRSQCGALSHLNTGQQQKLESKRKSTASLTTLRMGKGLAVGNKMLFSSVDQVRGVMEVNISKATEGIAKHLCKSKEVRPFEGTESRTV